jgi:hypothetical protein
MRTRRLADGAVVVMTQKPTPKSDESNQTKRDTQREVEVKQTAPALEKTLKKAGKKKLKKEPEGHDD